MTQLRWILLFLACGFSHAAGFVFRIDFLDGSGNAVGTGTYAFDDVTRDTNVSFDSLTGFSWSFILPVYGIAMNSASGDSTSRESTTQEGVRVTSVGPTVELRFFDSLGSFISHNDESDLPARTSVRFLEFSNTVQYIKNDITLGTGSYIATLIPEPSALGLAMMGGASLLWLRRRRAA